jgi:hypothetical protein
LFTTVVEPILSREPSSEFTKKVQVPLSGTSIQPV